MFIFMSHNQKFSTGQVLVFLVYSVCVDVDIGVGIFNILFQ